MRTRILSIAISSIATICALSLLVFLPGAGYELNRGSVNVLAPGDRDRIPSQALRDE